MPTVPTIKYIQVLYALRSCYEDSVQGVICVCFRRLLGVFTTDRFLLTAPYRRDKCGEKI